MFTLGPRVAKIPKYLVIARRSPCVLLLTYVTDRARFPVLFFFFFYLFISFHSPDTMDCSGCCDQPIRALASRELAALPPDGHVTVRRHSIGGKDGS